MSAVFARPARAPPTRGSSRRRGQAAGFTPTVQILALLLPIFRENCAGSGANSERIAELLHRNAELAGRQYLVPRLDQLGKWWTGENTRKNSPLLANGSLVVAVGKPKPRDVQGDSAPASRRKKQAKEAPTVSSDGKPVTNNGIRTTIVPVLHVVNNTSRVKLHNTRVLARWQRLAQPEGQKRPVSIDRCKIPLVPRYGHIDFKRTCTGKDYI